MQITKFVHSCLLIETADHAVLVDPGVMSAAAVDAAPISRLDAILITHSHGDHFHPELVKRLIVRFPGVVLSGTPEVLDTAREQGIPIGDVPSYVKTFVSPHEGGDPLFVTPPQQGYHIDNLVTHPGDCHNFGESRAVLALPVTAPWGASTTAMKVAIKLKPKYVLPIHDWHWSDQARAGMYAQFEQTLAPHGITFLSVQNCQSIEIPVS